MVINMDDIVSQWYEDTKNVDEMQDWNPALKEWEKTVAGHFPSGARILDIGCGLGREAFALCDLGFEVVGIDISKEVITRVKQLSADKGYKISFFDYDGEHLDFPNESFDVVLIWAQTLGLLYGEALKNRYLSATERIDFHFSLSCIGEGNGGPLQCSCLGNPRVGGAW